MAKSKAQAAAESAAKRVHVARFASARYGGIVVTFKITPDGVTGEAVFDRHPDKPCEVAKGLFWCPHRFAFFMLRFPAGKSSPMMRNMAALDVMEPHTSAQVEVK